MKKIDQIETMVKINNMPILVNKEVEKELLNYAVILDAKTQDTEIMCKYDKKSGEKKLPEWLLKLEKQDDKIRRVLLIKDIDNLEIKDQIKFKEILKYRAINGVKIPDNTIIFVSQAHNNMLNETIDCLLAKIY